MNEKGQTQKHLYIQWTYYRQYAITNIRSIKTECLNKHCQEYVLLTLPNIHINMNII